MIEKIGKINVILRRLIMEEINYVKIAAYFGAAFAMGIGTIGPALGRVLLHQKQLKIWVNTQRWQIKYEQQCYWHWYRGNKCNLCFCCSNVTYYLYLSIAHGNDDKSDPCCSDGSFSYSLCSDNEVAVKAGL